MTYLVGLCPNNSCSLPYNLLNQKYKNIYKNIQESVKIVTIRKKQGLSEKSQNNSKKVTYLTSTAKETYNSNTIYKSNKVISLVVVNHYLPSSWYYFGKHGFRLRSCGVLKPRYATSGCKHIISHQYNNQMNNS